MKTKMKKRTLHRCSALTALVLVMSLMFSMSPLAMAANLNSVHDILFDWEYYADNNPDVVQALGRTESAMRWHYETYGKGEGRAPSILFHPVEYSNMYPDIKQAFGDNWRAVYDHYVNHGIREERQGSSKFSLAVYKNTYEDLRNAFGSDNVRYLRHWREYGRYEGRITISNGTSNSSTSSAPSSATTMYVKTSNPNNQLNLRAGTSTSSQILAKLTYGTKLTVLGYTGSWAKVQVNGTTGYVSKDYLSSSNPVSSSSSAQISPSSGWDMPMKNAYCTWRSYSNMSWGSYNNNSGDRDYHLGIDIYGTNGTVYAAASGKVVAASNSSSGANGRYIVIQHTISGKTVYTFYAHLQSINVSSGDTVSKGQTIGTAGGSGYGSNSYYGKHLHFAITDAFKAGTYYGYATAFSGNKTTYGGVTFYNPVYVIDNDKLPS